MVGVGYINR